MKGHRVDSPAPGNAAPERRDTRRSSLWLFGAPYLCILLTLCFPLADLALSPARVAPNVDLGPLAGALLRILATATLFYVTFTGFRRAGLPHPLWSVLLLSAVVVTALLQYFLMLEQADLGWSVFVTVYTHLTVTLVVGGAAVLTVLHLTRGRGILWAAAALAAVVAARAALDGYTVEDRQQESLARARAPFDRVVYSLTGNPPARAVLDSEDWSAVATDRAGQITYQRADGAEISVSSWGSAERDPHWTEHDYAGPLRSGCVDEGTACEDFEAHGRSGVVFREGPPSDGVIVRVAVGADPQTYADVHLTAGPVGPLPEEVIGLAGDLRLIRDGDAERIAEEITGGPRP